jgi:hypothetical protein
MYMSLKKITTAVLAIGACLGFVAVLNAGSQNDAGCGLGSMIFEENRMADQVLAATTNGTFGNQTFGITTGTLNCGASAPDAVERRRSSVEQESFVAVNMRNLSREMAAGEGEYVASLASLLGCQESAVPYFGQFTQSRYGVLFPSTSVEPTALLSTLKSEMAQDAQLSSCLAL